MLARRSPLDVQHITSDQRTEMVSARTAPASNAAGCYQPIR